jgi:hypothetical protein
MSAPADSRTRVTLLLRLRHDPAEQRIGMRVSQVYVAKKRVQEMLREEVCSLDAGA